MQDSINNVIIPVYGRHFNLSQHPKANTVYHGEGVGEGAATVPPGAGVGGRNMGR